MEINDIVVAVVENDTEESAVRKSLIAQGDVKPVALWFHGEKCMDVDVANNMDTHIWFSISY